MEMVKQPISIDYVYIYMFITNLLLLYKLYLVCKNIHTLHTLPKSNSSSLEKLTRKFLGKVVVFQAAFFQGLSSLLN